MTIRSRTIRNAREEEKVVWKPTETVIVPVKPPEVQKPDTELMKAVSDIVKTMSIRPIVIHEKESQQPRKIVGLEVIGDDDPHSIRYGMIKTIKFIEAQE